MKTEHNEAIKDLSNLSDDDQDLNIGIADASDPSLNVCVLGSGSGGNCTVIKYQNQAMLLDAGLGPLTICRRLSQAKDCLQHIKAIVITHLDQDHFRPTWIKTMVSLKIPLYIHQWHIPDLQRLPFADELITSDLVRGFTGKFSPIENLNFTPIHLSHDEQGTFGYRIDSQAGSIGFATDMGHVPEELIQKFTHVDLLAIESNYDPIMQQMSHRPVFLKKRVMGNAGHLSNQQAFAAVQRIDRRSVDGCPKHIVLLHRSQQCNEPEKIYEVFGEDQSITERLVLTHQKRRSQWLKINSSRKKIQAPNEQMLFHF